MHLTGIVDRLIDGSDIITNREQWKTIVVNLVKEVVSSVDPDVRAGDSLDIRPYVKIKIIPGKYILFISAATSLHITTCLLYRWHDV